MKLLTACLTVSHIVCLISGRPQTYFGGESYSEANQALTQSFQKREDYDVLNLPPIQSLTGRAHSHPFNFNLTNDGSGNYYFGYNTPDESRSEIGELKNAGTENEIQTVRGQYVETYSTNNGYFQRTIGYTADDNGYKPFLIDISFVPRLISGGVPYASPPVVGAPKGEKDEIGGSVKAILIGGGLGK